jgi:signal transduction histidine kinase
MRLRQRSIRARVLVLVLFPLLALLGLYAFAATITAGDAITLARATDVRNSLADPVGLFTGQLQGECILATVYLAAPSPQDRAALTEQEGKTDADLAVVRQAADSASFTSASSSAVKAAMAVTLREAAGLPALRAKVISGAIDRAAEQSAYSQLIAASMHAISESILQMPDVLMVNQSLADLRMAEADDILVQSEALLVGDLTARHFPAADHAQFARLVGQYQGLMAEAMPDLEPVYLASFQHAFSPRTLAALQADENTVINSPAGALPRVNLTSYYQAAGAVVYGLGIAGYQVGQALASSLHQAAGPIDLRLYLAGGLGLMAIIVTILVSVWTGRGLVRQLAELRQGALELAHRRLPGVIVRLSAGEEVDIEAEAPPLATSPDEIGQVRQAFNSVQRSAIEAAVSQARLRAGISTIFRNLAQRSQALLHQQLSLLDALEQRATEPAELEGLFRIDHLTTRMRRHAEGLVVLAGDRPGRTWTDPVPMSDVLRGSVAEVVDYARIRVVCTSRAALEGLAVADAIHLIAELAENATVFSPPQTPVRIVGSQVVHGFAVEIEDRGLGMSEETMARYNAMFLNPPSLNLQESGQLGLYVAARLAHRHDIRITLRSSPFGGTTAIVLIPLGLIVASGKDAWAQAAGPAEGPRRGSGPLTGRHASRVTGTPVAQGGVVPGRNGDGPHGSGEPRGTGTLTADGSGPWELPEWMYSNGNGNGNGAGPRDRRAEPPEQPAAGGTSLTDFELPRRVRQASLSPQLREPESPDAAVSDDGAAAEPSADNIRDAMSAMQRGWERGRGDDNWPAESGATPPSGTAAPGRPEARADTDGPPEPPPADGIDEAAP